MKGFLIGFFGIWILASFVTQVGYPEIYTNEIEHTQAPAKPECDSRTRVWTPASNSWVCKPVYNDDLQGE